MWCSHGLENSGVFAHTVINRDLRVFLPNMDLLRSLGKGGRPQTRQIRNNMDCRRGFIGNGVDGLPLFSLDDGFGQGLSVQGLKSFCRPSLGGAGRIGANTTTSDGDVKGG